jgi:hypothetical protein
MKPRYEIFEWKPPIFWRDCAQICLHKNYFKSMVFRIGLLRSLIR